MQATSIMNGKRPSFAGPADPDDRPPSRGDPVDEPERSPREPGGHDLDTVLIVDDDPGVLEVLAMLLSDEGYRVATASNGREALAYLAGEEAPALILLDIMMPVMDGYAFRAAQREHPAFSAIPVVVLSAGEKSERITDLHAAAFLKKPFEVDALLTLVEKYRRKRPPRGES